MQRKNGNWYIGIRTTKDILPPILLQSVSSPLGKIWLGATERGICLLEFADRRCLPSELAALQKRFGRSIAPGRNAHIQRMREELRQYFKGKLRRFATPLQLSGTPFESATWKELRNIPYGETASYGEVARRIGRPGAQRAVGRANGANRVAIAVPCHRVIDSAGKLHGYGGGLWRKRRLLALESRGQRGAR